MTIESLNWDSCKDESPESSSNSLKCLCKKDNAEVGFPKLTTFDLIVDCLIILENPNVYKCNYAILIRLSDYLFIPFHKFFVFICTQSYTQFLRLPNPIKDYSL